MWVAQNFKFKPKIANLILSGQFFGNVVGTDVDVCVGERLVVTQRLEPALGRIQTF